MKSKEELLKELGWNSDLIRCFIGREISIIPNVAKNKLENIQDSSTTFEIKSGKEGATLVLTK